VGRFLLATKMQVQNSQGVVARFIGYPAQDRPACTSGGANRSLETLACQSDGRVPRMTATARHGHLRLWWCCVRRCCSARESSGRGGTVKDGGHISISSDPQAVIKSRSQGNGFAKTLRSRRRAHSQNRAKDRALPAALTNTPGPACMLCIIHASSRAVLDVIAISSSGPPSNTRPACAAVACVPTEIASRLPSSFMPCATPQVQATRRRWFAGCYPLCSTLLYEAVSLTLGTEASSWRMLHSGQLAAFAVCSKWRAVPSSTQLRCSFATGH